MEVRLQKFLAENGIASRRKCEELILKGLVKVNGEVVTELGTKINSDKDIVEFNNQEVKKVNKKVYILLNKPIGYVTTAKDQFGRDSVLDLVNDIKERIVPVGRLDMYTSGALLLSNDGEFINIITHPSNEIEKTYNVTVAGIVSNADINKLENGVEIQVDGKMITTQKAKEKEYELMLVKEKQKVFNHFFNVLFEIIISSKEHRKTNMPLVIKEYMNFKRGLMIWGSEEAINSFITFDRVFQNLSKEGHLDENEKIASLSVIEIILKSIRKDLKYSVSDKIFLTGVLLGIKEQQILKNL